MKDIIIVGAGTAGSVLAERLTSSGKLQVALIEAGSKPSSPFVKMPAGFARLFKSKLDWNLQSEPQACANGRTIFTPRGKMLGGSSNMNAQIHQWCHPTDFEEWVQAGAIGWGWEDVAPVFREQECWLGEETSVARGRNGPMFVSPNRNAHPLSTAFVEAAHAAGLSRQPHYNGEAYEGAWIPEIAHKDGQRFSAYNAYLEPAMKRPNLEVVRAAHVSRVEIENGRATGVTFLRDGALRTISARAVVLCAGAFGSPQLLMLSGIGPSEHLRGVGIPVYYDAPEVGENLQDHPLVPIVLRARGTDTFKKAAESPINLLRYLLFKRGPLSSNAVEGFAFTSSTGQAGAPADLELIFVPFEWRNEGLEPPKIEAFGFASVAARVRSRGTLRLRSGSPTDAPLIDFRLMSDPDGVDASVILAGARLGRKIAATEPLAQFVAEEVFPGAQYTEDAELLAQLNTRLQTVYHPTSTCRMGSDARSVVTPQLEVRGVDGLWVVDASVMPAVPRGHPNAVVAMIANRAVKLIASALDKG
jgi:choline dehydrogenase